MKNIKRLIAMLVSLCVMAASFEMCSAAVADSAYDKTYFENFEDAESVFGESGIFEAKQNVSESTVYTANSSQGGMYLEVSSDGSDVQIRTKKGVFAHDVTVVDMVVSAVCSSAFPLIRLFDNDAKIGSDNGLFRFVNSNQGIRSYNQVTGSYDSVTLGNEWVNVRIVLDSINNTITTSFNGSHAVTVSEMAEGWSNENVQLGFQVALNSAIMIDDFTISDGRFMSDIVMCHNFEKSSTVNAAVGNNFFHGINKSQNHVVTYDEESLNTYLDITNASGCVIYTKTFGVYDSKPAVFEFDLKTDATTNGSVYLRQSQSVKPVMFKIENGVVKGSESEADVSDGDFHRYRVIFAPADAGYSKLVFVDDVLTDNETTASNVYSDTNVDLRIETAANSPMAIDNLKIFYPQLPEMYCALDKKENAYIDSVIELVLNTPIDESVAENVTITADGQVVSYDVSPNAERNSYTYEIDGGLDYNTNYVITGDLWDIYGQVYTVEFAFKTSEKTATEEGVITAKINGNEAENGILVNGAMEIAFKVKANTESGATAFGKIEQYDARGNLLRADEFPILVEGMGEKIQRAGLEVTDNIESIKMYIRSESNEPIEVVSELVR